jgi:hypothetical protein
MIKISNILVGNLDGNLQIGRPGEVKGKGKAIPVTGFGGP